MSAIATMVDRIASRTPRERERAIDGFRALAICGVVLGHWMVGALVLGSDGALGITSPLSTLGFLAPVSWLFQMLGLFFLVGGYAAAKGWSRAESRGEGYPRWLLRRYVRLARPVLLASAASAVAITGLAAAGVPGGTLRTWMVLFVQPLWFIAIYALVTAFTRYAVAADRRLGAWAALPLLAVVALVDVLRYGPWQDAMPGWLGMVNLLPGWLFAYQLGVSWASGRLRAAGARLLLVGGGVLFALLLLRFGYPASMVGVPGQDRANAHPPSLLVLALGATQSGAAILLKDRAERWLRRPGPWAVVVVLNLAALTVFCWHQVPNIVVSMVGGAVGGALPGLTTAAADPSWVAARVAWVPLLAVVLIGLVALMARFEHPRKSGRRDVGHSGATSMVGPGAGGPDTRSAVLQNQSR